MTAGAAVRLLVWFFVGFSMVGLLAFSLQRPDPGQVVSMIHSMSQEADPSTVRAIERALLGL